VWSLSLRLRVSGGKDNTLLELHAPHSQGLEQLALGRVDGGLVVVSLAILAV
jgi:hypothetical protein